MPTDTPLTITADHVPYRTHLEAELQAVEVQRFHVERRYLRDVARLEDKARELLRRIDLEG